MHRCLLGFSPVCGKASLTLPQSTSQEAAFCPLNLKPPSNTQALVGSDHLSIDLLNVPWRGLDYPAFEEVHHQLPFFFFFFYLFGGGSTGTIPIPTSS